jgi:hypothetical protein
VRALALLCLPVAAAAVGCGSGASEREAKEVAARFAIALEQRDGAAACELLGEATRAAVQLEEGRPCAEAILDLPLPRDAASSEVRVYLTSAIVRLARGSTTFLDEADSRWTISAAGCRPTRPGEPYRCELED